MPKAAQDDTMVYLVKEELAFLTPAAKKKWEKSTVMETLTAYETPEQIDARMRSVSYDNYPKLKEKLDRYFADMNAGKTAMVDLKDFPEEAVDSFLFSIGASGISFFIHLYLRDERVLGSNDGMEAVAALSRARHRILEKNQAVFA